MFSVQSFAKECPYPADPINWIMRYCAYITETGDEIAIQDSKCFKDADKESDSAESCDVKKKYKTKYCTASMKKIKKYKTLQECLQDTSIEPFFAGG